MAGLRLLYRDVDRTPFLFTLRQVARGHGLDLEYNRPAPGDTRWADRLEAEEIDVIAENYWGLQNNRAKGAPFVTLASVSNAMPERLMGDASIKSIADLTGKRMAVRQTGPQLLYPTMWLKDHGLLDVVTQQIYSERETGRWGHWQKVADGECHACFMTDLYLEKAIDAGLHVIPEADLLPFVGGNVTLTTTENLTARKRSELQTLVDSTFEAIDVFRTQPDTVLRIMREECLDLLKEHFEIPDDQWLVNMHRLLAEELADTPVPVPEGLINAVRIQVDQEPHLRTFNPMLMWDLSFARNAMK
jgi:ABC-type nitrate/sulfonate/bicarbonate transport system substrate-binding protein